jgi:hypothetical protein
LDVKRKRKKNEAKKNPARSKALIIAAAETIRNAIQQCLRFIHVTDVNGKEYSEVFVA